MAYLITLYILLKLVKAGYRHFNQASYYSELSKFIAKRRKLLDGPEREGLFKLSERVRENAEKFLKMDIAQLRKAMNAGEISSLELVNLYGSRIQE